VSTLRSIEETAAQLSISPWTVRAYIAQGKLARVKVGRRTLVEDSEIVSLTPSVPPLRSDRPRQRVN
jgi:excisionase family DNA binding protein